MGDNVDLCNLVELALCGDANAMDGVFERIQAPVLAVVRRHLPNSLRRDFDSMDILQSVVVEVLREFHRFEFLGERPFRSWLNIKVLGKIRTKLRRHLRREFSGGRLEIDDVSDPRESRSPIGALLENEEAGRARRALLELGGKQQAVVRYRIEDGLTFAEIAHRCGLGTEDAARKRYARALDELRVRCKTTEP